MKLHTNPPVDGRPVERAAFIFYTIAALGSSIGQIWVGVVTPPWPPTVPWSLRAILVLPFAVVLDLGGVVTAAFADWRQRKGERAYAWRVLSATWITVGVGINVVGHADNTYLAVVFGALGCFAYAVWLLHAASRRRDALRAAGKLDDTAPTYGFRQWRREPEVTARARALALEHGLSRLESLRHARQQLRDERRNRALQQHITKQIQAQHEDPVLAAIASTTAPVDQLAAELAACFDVAGWVQYLTGHLQAPTPPPAVPQAATTNTVTDGPQPSPLEQPAAQDEPDSVEDSAEHDDQNNARHPALSERRPHSAVSDGVAVPRTPAGYDRWRSLWQDLTRSSSEELPAFAHRHNLSVRTLQRIRQAGEAGMLDQIGPSATGAMAVQGNTTARYR